MTVEGDSLPARERWGWFLALCLAIASACGDRDDAAGRGSQPGAAEPGVLAPVARVETAGAWQDLIAQRPSAVILRDGAVEIDLGRQSARKHLALGYRDAWRLGQSMDDRAAAVVIGRTGALDVPLDGSLAPALNRGLPPSKADSEAPVPGLALALTLKPLVKNQSVTVLWNERPLANLTLAEGWERRTISLPDDAVQPGDNRLRLHFRRVGPYEGVEASAAIARVEAGTHTRITAPPKQRERSAYRVTAAPGGKTALAIPAGVGLAYYVVPPPRSKLALDVEGQGAVQVLVSTSEDHAAGHPPKVVLDEPLRPTGRRAQLDLSGWGGHGVRLEIQIRGRDAEAGATLSVAEIANERIIPVDDRTRAPRDILVLGIEGARADAFESGQRPALEAFDALASSAVVFERAYAVSPAAVPSHAAWLSSVAPSVHITVHGTFVANGQTLLTEALSRAGYFRTVITANEDFDEARGLLQGVDFRTVVGGQGDDDGALGVIEGVLQSLQKRPGRWYGYANVNDPQAPYEPPREWLRDAMPAPPKAPMPHLTHLWVGRVRMGKAEPSAAELAYVQRLYRGELQVVDAALGQLLERLRAQRRLDDAIVVVVGIHGEEFYEHRGAGHGRTLYEESLRVPLMIRAPSLLDPRRVKSPVDLLDLAPTLADLVGAPKPDAWQGESLLPTLNDPEPPPRLVIGYLGDGSRAGIVGYSKLVLGPGHTEQFFDLNADPTELHDALATGGVELRIVRNALAWQLGYEQRWRRARWGTGANLSPAFAMDLGM